VGGKRQNIFWNSKGPKISGSHKHLERVLGQHSDTLPTASDTATTDEAKLPLYTLRCADST